MRKKAVGIALFVISSITLGTYFLFMRIDTNQAHINKIFDIARNTRPTPLSKLKYVLQDYSAYNNITKTIQSFLRQEIKLKVNLENIKQSNGSPQAGLSGNPLFFIQDNQNDLKMVVKVFENPFDPTGEFISELSGFQLASTIKGKNFNIISAKGVGKAVINGKTYGLIAISPASGTNMQDLVLKIIRRKPDSPERNEALDIAKQSFERLGKALAELHQIRTEKNVSIHYTLIERAKQNLNNVIRHLCDDNHGIDTKALKQYFEQLKNELKKVTTTRSIAHGDPHLGNFMYDEREGTIFIVDLSSFHFAADREGNPIQNAALDFMGILDIISVNKAFGMNEEEQAILRKAFTNSYGSTPTEIEQKFFALERQLDTLSFFLEPKKASPDKTLTKTDRITNLILKFEIEKLKESVNRAKASFNF